MTQPGQYGARSILDVEAERAQLEYAIERMSGDEQVTGVVARMQARLDQVLDEMEGFA